MPEYSQIRYDPRSGGGVAVITLNRPEARNAFSRRMTLEMDDALSRAAADNDVRAILLHGAGTCFSSGHDLGSKEQVADLQTAGYLGGLRGDHRKWSDLDTEMCLKWRQLHKPIVAAVHGYCIYHACAVVSCCDIVVAADDVEFMPSMVEATFLPWDTHPRRAKEIMLMRRFVLAEEAQALGIVSRVVPRAHLMEEARAAALHVARADSFQLEMMKGVCNNAQDASGLTTSLRSALVHWTAFRGAGADPDSKANVGPHGAARFPGKRLAPTRSAKSGTAWEWTEAQNRAAKARL